jgi:NitT/TauT family transport system substrate-binding protein
MKLVSGMIGVASILLCCAAPPAVAEADLEKIVVSLPGPRGVSYLPIDLIPRIGVDRAEGVRVEPLHVSGGGIALQELTSRNSDFAVLGLSAVISARARGSDVLAVAAVNDLPLYILMVRAKLKGQVNRVEDLRGRVIGVYTSSLSTKTVSQQLAELVLKSANIAPEDARLASVGQSWQGISSMLRSGAVDAVMGGEPFASRLLAGNEVFFLLNLNRPDDARRIPGAGFLRGSLQVRGETVRNDPHKVEKMVRILRRALQWMASHTPEEIIEKLAVADSEERASLLAALKKYPRLYSPDGRFSSAQLRETERFYREAAGNDPQARALSIESVVDDRWAGRKP